MRYAWGAASDNTKWWKIKWRTSLVQRHILNFLSARPAGVSTTLFRGDTDNRLDLRRCRAAKIHTALPTRDCFRLNNVIKFYAEVEDEGRDGAGECEASK